MPSSNLLDTGLALLTRDTPLTEEERFEWLRRRSRRIASKLRYFNHRNLGHINAIGGAHTLWENAKFTHRRIPDQELNSALATRGIFFPPRNCYRAGRVGDQDRIIWGITDDGVPTLATITYEIVSDLGGTHVALKAIRTRSASLQDISLATEKSVSDLAQDLKSVVRQWLKEVSNNFDMINLLWHEVCLEDDMQEIIERRERQPAT